jgi:hypothetical protein
VGNKPVTIETSLLPGFTHTGKRLSGNGVDLNVVTTGLKPACGHDNEGESDALQCDLHDNDTRIAN